MKKLFLAVCSMIVTGFLMKSYRKLREKPDTEEEAYEDHLKIERRQADARTTFNGMDAISALPPSPNTGLVKSWRETMRNRK